MCLIFLYSLEGYLSINSVNATPLTDFLKEELFASTIVDVVGVY
jgi:hypothetical protein